jgi:hypothetical protein
MLGGAEEQCGCERGADIEPVPGKPNPADHEVDLR